MVAGEQGRGIGSKMARGVRVADDLHAVPLHHVIRRRALDIAPLGHRQIEDHAARLHAGDLFVRDQPRRGPARDQRGRDDDILLGDMARNQLGLRGLVFLAHLGRVAARSLALDPGDVLDEDRLGAEREDLLFRRRPDIGRRNLRAQPLGGGDRLQPGDAHAHHEDLGRLHRAGGGHHHREGAAIDVRRRQHRLVAGKVRLAGKHVHALRARDARHEFHRQRLEPGIGIGLDPVAPGEGIEQRGDHGPRPGAGQRHDVGRLDAEDDVRPLHRLRAGHDVGPGFAIGGIGDRRGSARAFLHRDAGAERQELLDRFGRGGDPGFPRGPLFQDRDPQGAGGGQLAISRTISSTMAATIGTDHLRRLMKPPYVSLAAFMSLPEAIDVVSPG